MLGSEGRGSPGREGLFDTAIELSICTQPAAVVGHSQPYALIGGLAYIMRAALHQCLLLLECLAVHSQAFGLLVQLKTGSAGAACDRTPEQMRLSDVSGAFNQQRRRQRGEHR